MTKAEELNLADLAREMDRQAASRSGVRVEAFTVAWMVVEATVGISAGVAARSVLLTTFGFDSVIELMSGAALFWRMRVEARGGNANRVAQTERQVEKVSAVLLTLLSIYVLATSGLGLLLRIEPEGSLAGLVMAAAAVVVMPLLAMRKRAVNRTLDSDALRADIVATLTCALMAGATLIGVALNTLLHWWWADYVAAFVLLLWLVPETREAIEAAREGSAERKA